MTATPEVPHPSEANVVEVYGSRFLLEWLDREVLASAAALHLADRAPVGPSRRVPAARDREPAPTAG
ncbi:hypothetical protein [Blastococcus deserti]|uniref:Uncharacterized protein n=1 Tax=Blastococcus deserti TaxID=2259033 RepID=A0ABW4XIX8_9ACTN